MSRCGNTPNCGCKEPRIAVCRSRCQRTDSLPSHKNLPCTVPVRAPDRFLRFQQIAANDRQTFDSYRYGNNVSLASAQEDSRGSPATANVTGSRREISRQATRPASPQVPSHYRVFPLKSPVRLAVALMASVPAHHRPASASERR